jgi:hypothetical protein
MNDLIGKKFNVVDASKEHEKIISFQCVDKVWMCKIATKDEKASQIELELESCLGYLIQLKLPVSKDNINIALELLAVGKLNDKDIVVAFADPTEVKSWDIIDAVLEKEIEERLPNAKIQSMVVGTDFVVITVSTKAQAKKLEKAKWITKLGARTKRNDKQVLVLKQEI